MKLTEENFISELKRGNEKALVYVVDQYGSLLCGIIRRKLCLLKEYQEECLNDVFSVSGRISAIMMRTKTVLLIGLQVSRVIKRSIISGDIIKRFPQPALKNWSFQSRIKIWKI